MIINYQKELNQEQYQAVVNGDGPCLVLAGAGSGKTRTVTYRVAYLLEKGVNPDNILLLTFTNKAAKEMIGRIQELIGDQARDIWSGTFHSIANHLLRSFAEQLGYTRSFSILDEEDARSLIKSIIKDAKINTSQKKFPNARILKNIHSYSVNTQTALEEVLETKFVNYLDLKNDIEFIINEYKARKIKSNNMDFDDLLLNWSRLMDQYPDSAQRISDRFQYILVDEFQDTNSLQINIINKVAQVHKNIFAVGDDAQSIYAFRGADVKNILNFPHHWEGSKVFKLLSNYRSTPEILEVANQSLANNLNQYEKDLKGLKKTGIKPNLILASSSKQEAEYIVNKILELKESGIPYSEIAVLFRASSHSQMLEFELMKNNIPFEYRGGLKFFERAHIKDISAFLRILLNFKDEPSWLRVLNMQPGIGLVSAGKIIRIIQEVNNLSDIDPEAIPGRSQNSWSKVLELILKFQNETKPGTLIRSIANSELYKEYLVNEFTDWKDRLDDLEQLAIFADYYGDLTSFLADSVLDDTAFIRQQGTSNNEQRIILSTIHQAKGLEWKAVFVIRLTNMSFPSMRSLNEEDGLEEERRLFYVAVTRAQDNLYLTYPRMIGFEENSYTQPSLFLEELPNNLLEKINFAHSFQENNTNFSDDFIEDSVLEIGSDGEYHQVHFNKKPRYNQFAKKTPSVWKKNNQNKSPNIGSLLRNVDEL